MFTDGIAIMVTDEEQQTANNEHQQTRFQLYKTLDLLRIET